MTKEKIDYWFITKEVSLDEFKAEYPEECQDENTMQIKKLEYLWKDENVLKGEKKKKAEF